MGGFGRWSADFYDFTVKLDLGDGDELGWFGDVHDRAARNGARHGTPILTSPSGETDPRINLFFRTGAMAGSAVSTWRRYAYSLVVWLEFLEMAGRGWDQATTGDVEAFKHWRLTDLRNLDRVKPTSFDTDRAALNAFYMWAGPRYGVVNPVATVRSGSRGRRMARHEEDSGNRRGGRDGLRPTGARRRQVKWLLRPALDQWRDVGLRGYGFGGLRRAGWSGGSEDRDVAFVEGLYGTGLRLREWSSVLDVELPAGVTEYRARVERAAAFAGRTVTGVRNVTRLLATVDPDIHHGEAMTCVYRAETAVCRAAKIAEGLPGGDGPDDSQCRSTCTNLATPTAT